MTLPIELRVNIGSSGHQYSIDSFEPGFPFFIFDWKK
jgi:hypothetical protein